MPAPDLFIIEEGNSLKNSILIALNDSISSRVMIDFVANLPLRREEFRITLLHVYRKPAAVEELMGQRFTNEQLIRFQSVLEESRVNLVQKGFLAEKIKINLELEPYDTVTDGIIDQFHKEDFDMVVIGRKSMTKAEEFVLGDISVKLIRDLKGASVLVVKTP